MNYYRRVLLGQVCHLGDARLICEEKDRTLKLCIDYIEPNKITIKNKYSLPWIDDLFDQQQGARVLLKIDLSSGYHHLRTKPEDILENAFRTKYDPYEFIVIPYKCP